MRMKSSNPKMHSALTVGSLIVGAGLLSLFQNCGKVNFAAEADQTKALNIVASPCVDTSGVSHDSGTTWQTTETTVTPVTCADSAASSQGYANTTSYACQSGAISTTGTTSQLVAPTASCPAPMLNATLTPSNPQRGGSSTLKVASQAVHDVQYTCKSVANGSKFSGGSLAVGTASATLSNIVEDLSCDVSAVTSDATIKQTLNVNVDCESSGLLKDPTTHTCVQFKCQSYVSIPARSDGVYEIPARTTAGVCYSVKLMNAIAGSNSALSTSKDTDVVSRNHTQTSANSALQWNPYVLGKSSLSFVMNAGGGARQVQLSGSGQTASSIRVDNFLVVGLAKHAVGLSTNAVYRSYGTSDSTIDAANSYILFRNAQLPLKSFGGGGTSTIGTLDITTQVSTSDTYDLDVRALDCGGARELSDIYLVFQ